VRIEFARPLKDLLEESEYQGALRSLADRVGEILADNKLPFFPDYTDHGVDHVNRVLKSEISLVPPEVWKQSRPDSTPRLLYDADAAVIIGATLLHDIAMHLQPHGFVELIRQDTRFQPLPWFTADHEGHSADRPWHELWLDYVREARQFNDRTLGNIIGPESVRNDWKFEDLPEDLGQWDRNHCLVIGEFIRRHHARLAHEVAIYGFPGLSAGFKEGEFPAVGRDEGHPLARLGDLIGLTARSHGTSLRVCKAYLDAAPLYAGTPRPMGTAVLFPMALLRIADYLQIDRKRAPAVLLQLRHPPSPVSVQEWTKHLAVQSISPATDPRGQLVTVSPDVSLELYLELDELVARIQAEMDHSTAVLAEAYGARSDLGLDRLGLATRRVYSNLHSPAFRESLPYVPERTGFSADPNLLTLLVEPLYGKNPSVGVRELIQNAVDAARELYAWCEARRIPIASLDLPEQDSDVLVDFVERQDGTWLLRVTDKGIGMRSDTIQNYFLRAGASFRQSADWAKDFLDEQGQPRVLRAGRFGIGAFAIFLLGATFRLRTRHAGAEKAMGYFVQVSADSKLIEVRREKGLPVGTTIEVEIDGESVAELALEKETSEYSGPGPQTDWFCCLWPKVTRRILRGANTEPLVQKYAVPYRGSELPRGWSVVHPKRFDAVFWTFLECPPLICNGLRIAAPGGSFLSDAEFGWPDDIGLERPNIAVSDGCARLPLNTQRYALSRHVPFIAELTRDVVLSFIAHALVRGPTSRVAAHSKDAWRLRHPLVQVSSTYDPYSERTMRPPFSDGLLRWCSTRHSLVPTDRWLCSLLKTDTCVLYGGIGWAPDTTGPWTDAPPHAATVDHVILSLDADCRFYEGVGEVLEELTSSGIAALGFEPIATRVIVSKWAKVGFGSSGWREITSPPPERLFAEHRTGSMESTLPLEQWVADVGPNAEGDSEGDYVRQNVCYYAAEIKTKHRRQRPETLIAAVWNECLGPHAIPFDPDERRALIEHGREHPELKRHIEAWEEMNARGEGLARY
jgi:molecular chaperone HtpG